MARVTLRKGRVRPVWAGHPWVFAQAIARVDGAPAPGDAVEVRDPEGHFLGRGFWSPKSAIPVRIVTRDPQEPLDEGAIVRRVERAAALRRQLGLPREGTDGYRLIHAEGDGLPGLIADVYREAAVIQLGTHGMKRYEDIIAHAVGRVSGAKTVLEVASRRAQEREGLSVEPRVIRGPDRKRLEFTERGFSYAIEIELAQKTGFYFDQRENRARIEGLARGRRVLDLYSYVGAFGLAAARGGAEIVDAWDSSAPVIAEGASIAYANGLGDKVRFAKGDARRVMQKLAQDGERYDMVILDPPKLAPTAKHLAKARKAYQRLNASAMALVNEGGVLATCSCSAAMTEPELLRMVALAAKDARREATLLAVGHQGMDHPTLPAFPEGRYLDCAFVRLT